MVNGLSFGNIWDVPKNSLKSNNFSNTNSVSIFDSNNEKSVSGKENNYKDLYENIFDENTHKHVSDAFKHIMEKDPESPLVQIAISNSVKIDGALGIDDSSELKDKSGSELFDMYKEYADEFVDGGYNVNGVRENAALIKLLGNASSDQIKDFMESYKAEYGEEKFKRLGEDTLNWAKYTVYNKLVSEEDYNKFMDTLKDNSQYFPDSKAAQGFQYL